MQGLKPRCCWLITLQRLMVFIVMGFIPLFLFESREWLGKKVVQSCGVRHSRKAWIAVLAAVIQVQVLVGWDKGKIGEIDRIVKERNWVFVAGLNKKKMLPNSDDSTMLDGPLLINHEVKLVDPEDMKQTEIEWRYTDEGDRVRVSVRTGRIIPIPEKWADTWEDGINSKKYTDSPKDTPLRYLRDITFIPTNSTFEETILKQHGLYKPKKKRKTYWY